MLGVLAQEARSGEGEPGVGWANKPDVRAGDNNPLSTKSLALNEQFL